MYMPYNPNPINLKDDDCVIRALTKALDMTWEEVYMGLCLKGLELYRWGNNNLVWGEYLYDKGFVRAGIPNTCPMCYTINEFCSDNPTGTYILGTGTHAVAVVDGNYYDTWDSGDEVPMYMFRKE